MIGKKLGWTADVYMIKKTQVWKQMQKKMASMRDWALSKTTTDGLNYSSPFYGCQGWINSENQAYIPQSVSM